MNRLLASTLTLVLVSANPDVLASSMVNLPLPASQSIAPHTSMEIPLDTLMQGVPYTVSCTLETTAPSGTDINIAPHLVPDSGFGVVTLNNQPALKNTGTLSQGKNTLSVMVSVAEDSKSVANSLVLKILDDRHPLTLKACHALPVTRAVTSASTRVMGGYFYVTNHLPYFLDIMVGNYLPIPYCIYPFLRQYIQVTSSYQDIDVLNIHY